MPTFKQQVYQILSGDDLHALLQALQRLPASRTMRAVMSGICEIDTVLKWHSVSALGRLVAERADAQPESARVIMRRLMWSLTEEAGGIGWGAPESMAEIMACHENMAREYVHLFVSLMREDGNFLEFEPLQQGVMWGLGRLAGARPHVFDGVEVAPFLPLYCRSSDDTVRGLAARAAGLLRVADCRKILQSLRSDQAAFTWYDNGVFIRTTVAEQANAAINRF